MAKEEDAFWETGKCSGTMYCGDHEHYDFMNEAFGLFAHVNALQRDMCPSKTKFEGEIIAMTLDLLHADAVTDGRRPGRARHHRRHRQHPARGARLPRARARDPRHHPAELRQARDRAPRVRQGVPPVRRRGAQRAGRPGDHAGRRRLDAPSSSTTTRSRIIGSACNYGYGTDRPDRRAVRPRARARRRPARRRLPRRVHPAVRPGARLRHPGLRLPRSRASRSISADTHKYGYGFKGTSVLRVPRQGAAQQPVLLPDRLDRRQVLLARHRGLTLGRPARGDVGRDGLARPRRLPAATPGRSSRPSVAMQDAVRSHPELRIIGQARRSASASRPTSSTSTTSTTSCGPGLALQRPAVPERDPHGGHPSADPARLVEDRSRPTSPTRSRTPKEHTDEAPKRARSTAASQAGSTRRRVHPRRHGRHARQAPSPATRMSETAGRRSSSRSTSARVGPRSGSSRCRRDRLVRPPPVSRPGGTRRRQVQDADEWWELIVLVRTPCRRRPPTSAGRGGQLHRPVGLDGPGRRGRVARSDCQLWMDSRGEPYSRAVIGGPVSGYSPVPLAAWVRRSGGLLDAPAPTPSATSCSSSTTSPRSSSRARWFLEPVDYLSMRFTGVPAASHASMTGAWLTDNRSLATLAYDAELVRATGVDASRLPPLGPTGSVVGTCRRRWPRTRPSRRGAGRHRHARPALGRGRCGCDRPGRDARVDQHHRLAQCTGAVQEERPAPDAPRSRAWTTRRTSSPTTTRPPAATCSGGASRSPPISRYDDLLAEAVATPSGGRRGRVHPVAHRRAVAGRRPQRPRRVPRDRESTTRGHLVRAVLEGVALNSPWLHEAVEKFVGSRLDDVRLIGGGAHSDLWCQIHADTSDRSIVRVTDPWLANLRGASPVRGPDARRGRPG